MKRGRLSLGRRPFNESSNVVEISDDDVTICEATSVSSSMTVASKSNSRHYVLEDSSSDEDVTVDDVPSTFNKSPSLFNWNKTNDMFWNGIKMNFAADTLPCQSNFPESSDSHSSRQVMPTETPNKKQKVMNDWTDDDDEISILDIREKDNLPSQVGIQYELLIAGTKVKFPVKPYSCQKSLVGSLITGCTKEENCLLESPTGSGKTLALLCGALAWQEQYSEKICREAQSDGMVESSCCYDDSVENNFFLNASQYFDEETHDKISDKARKVPKIYYGTRTHKQIEQVIRELKKTAYRHKRMTILSSRDNTCIQDTERNKTELCYELLDPLKGKKCQYHSENNKKHFDHMQSPWDIEDLVSLGRNLKSCPYFGARALMANANIIFCPYNYILDPGIRDSMQINLKGSIVILDEAHNIEDICREAANVILRDDEIKNAAKNCEDLSKKRNHDGAMFEPIQIYLTDMIKFLQNVDVEQSSFNNGMVSKCWLGNEFRVLLDINNVGCPRFIDFRNASTKVINDFIENTREEKSKTIMPTISRETKNILEKLCFAMQMIESDIFVNDYRMYIAETVEILKPVITKDGWMSKDVKKGKVRTMKMLCMNPAIIFAPLAHNARSVILASGTLTPTASFQSELGAQFRIVNPNHIVPKDQVYVRCISQARNGEPLRTTYENINKWDTQDNLGNLVLEICNTVPYGVLCFFSSYNTMNTIHNRWMNTDIWDKLCELKQIFIEPQNNKNMHEVMREYRSVIKESSSESFRVACGAIMFAVFRGKMAEGIDFSDNEARCVLAIGIPYLCKNNDINMKMDYNTANIKTKGLLSGREWYTVNAFRALNQGIGRCVRHINDWGAVLLVDERFMQSKYTDYLPKWIKTNIKSDNKDLEIDLQDFVAIQVARERGRKCIANLKKDF
ncbi:Fanconi anemia group J protein isoform X2 [Monomorium pharaonis]|nr:Fanconi anemia group J protein isoform X2 [Monomorium pharaonis]